MRLTGGMRSVGLALLLVAASACTDDGGPSTDDLGFEDGFDDSQGDGKTDLSGVSVPLHHRFSDSRLYPEGAALDPTDRSIYVGSIERGSITRVNADGTESTIFAGGEKDRFTLGMQVDAARRRLWVCTTKDSLGTVWLFDLNTNTRTRSIDLTRVNPKAACNDVLIDNDGSILISDRENEHIYRADAQGRLSVWANDPKLGGAVISLNGLVFTPDHSAVITATYLPPTLVRVSTSNPRDVKKVKLDGAFFMDGFNLLNGPDDPLMRDDGTLLVAFGSSIKTIIPDDVSWARATVSSQRSIGGVTALVADGDTVYGINGQSVRYLLGLSPAPFQIFEVD